MSQVVDFSLKVQEYEMINKLLLRRLVCNTEQLLKT